jgi:hypothetical protein
LNIDLKLRYITILSIFSKPSNFIEIAPLVENILPLEGLPFHHPIWCPLTSTSEIIRRLLLKLSYKTELGETDRSGKP